ncbi:hypothetical protein ACN38_g4849 [Penicillium nordicum]|uniref:Uncharacterized protein n=1 Tax=Penicillium nordicum TaxID=229535 RepID=A0A0M8PAR5_9EURO|nr:hypothetical protein ACN38_g4849 [Penicillium nordicum]
MKENCYCNFPLSELTPPCLIFQASIPTAYRLAHHLASPPSPWLYPIRSTVVAGCHLTLCDRTCGLPLSACLSDSGYKCPAPPIYKVSFFLFHPLIVFLVHNTTYL